MLEEGGRSLTGARWRVEAVDEAAVARLSEELKLGRVAAHVLVGRGLAEVGAARRFLAHDLDDLQDPGEMRDMDRATALVSGAVEEGAPIRIYGDFDVDGVCATALMVRALSGLGAKVDWYIPHRVEEGYGVNKEAVREAAAEGIKLLITVDCGTTAVEEVALARELGMEVVVTDHHRPGDELPEAPVLNPWRADCGYPFKELAGVGVAFKLVTSLARARGLPEGSELRFLDLVCLGTVADVVPLLGENRVFVHHGMQRMATSKKLGLVALMEAADVRGKVGTREVAFGMAPRINAAGRMGHAEAAVKMLLTQDPEEARRLAQELSAQNEKRRKEERQTLAEAQAQVEEGVDLSHEKVLVLESESWHPGVIGIVASRLVERYHRPTLLIAVQEGAGKGSGRSIRAFNLWEGLRECAPLLTRYGGHRYAAGFGVAVEQIGRLRERINEVADSQLTAADLVREVEVAGEAELSELSWESVSELNELEPFGMGNPTPVLATRGVRVATAAKVGDGSHLSMKVEDGEGRVTGAIWFRQGALMEQLPTGAMVDVCYRPKLDEWNGQRRVRLHIEDVRVR